MEICTNNQMTNFKEEVRKVLNGLVQDCQDMDSHIKTVNLSVTQATSVITELVKGITSNLGDACEECDECRTEILKRLD